MFTTQKENYHFQYLSPTPRSSCTIFYLLQHKCSDFYTCVFSLQVETLGMHEEWKGGQMDSYGGGYKINLLRKALEPYQDDDKKIVLFTDR